MVRKRAMLKNRADALYVCADPLINANRIRIVTSAPVHGCRPFLAATWPATADGSGLAVVLTRYETRRHPGRAADQIRVHPQLQDRQGAGPGRAFPSPATRRRMTDFYRQSLLHCMSLDLDLVVVGLSVYNPKAVMQRDMVQANHAHPRHTHSASAVFCTIVGGMRRVELLHSSVPPVHCEVGRAPLTATRQFG